MLALLALCALLGGGGIAPAHVHPVHPPVHPPAYPVARDGTDRSATLSMLDEDCALCDALAAFEPLLPGGAPVAAIPAIAAALVPVDPVAAYPLPAPRGPGWRSRAPPVSSPT